MDIVVVGLHWGGLPDSPPTSALVSLPDIAPHGVQNVEATQLECFYADGQLADVGDVVTILASAEYLSKILCEGTSQAADMFGFVEDVVGSAPLGSNVFSTISMPEPMTKGVWLHLDDSGAVRCLISGTLSDDMYVSAAEDDLPTSPALLLTEVLPAGRKGGSRLRRPSVLTLGGANAKALAAMLSSRPAPAAAAARGKAPPAKATEKDMLNQLLTAVSSLGDRMTALEAGHQHQQQQHQRAPSGPPPRAATPLGTTSKQPSVPAMAPGPGFLPASTMGPAPGVSMIGAPPPGPAGSAAYDRALSEARRLLSVPDTRPGVTAHSAGQAFREDSAPGGA
eukprot:4821460-Amphidinium_carterae.1